MRAPAHTCRAGCVYASVCTRPHGSVAAPTPGVCAVPPVPPVPQGWVAKGGAVGCYGDAGLLGVGAPQCSGQPGPPLLSPFPASGAGSAASGCTQVINHVAGVHARTHGRRRSRGLLGAAPHAPLFPGTHPPCPASSPTPLEISSCFAPFPLHPFALESSELVSRRGSRQEELQWGCFPQPAAIDK